METFWCRHRDFQNLVRKNWNGIDYYSASKNFMDSIKPWKDKNFEDIFGKKKKILARLQGIQNSRNYPNNDFLHTLEDSLKKRLQ